MIKADKDIKFFVEDTYEDENNRVFTSKKEVIDYLKELNDNASDEEYSDDNVKVYSLENAVELTVKTTIELEAK